jgi:site-specific recombinase XerD
LNPARPALSRRLILVRYPRKLPEMLSVEEVGVGAGIKYKGILGAAYGAGLWVSEVASLQVGDFDRFSKADITSASAFDCHGSLTGIESAQA